MNRSTLLGAACGLFLATSLQAHAVGFQVFLGAVRPEDDAWAERYDDVLIDGATCLSGFWNPLGARLEIGFSGRKKQDPLDYDMPGRYEFKGDLQTFRLRLTAFVAYAPSDNTLLYAGAGPTFVAFSETVGTHDPTLRDANNYQDSIQFDETSGSGMALHALVGINLNMLVIEAVYEKGTIDNGMRDVDVGGMTYRLGVGFFFQR